MRFVWTVALKDLRRLRRDPSSILTWLAIPLMFVLLLRVIFGGGEAKPQGRLLVVDEDASVVSSLLTGAFGRGPMGEMVLVEKVALQEGRRRIDRGDASALLIVPKGMQDAFLANRPVHLQLITNPEQRILPKIIEETMAITVDSGFYLQQLAGDQLRAFAAPGPPTDASVSASSIAINQTISRLRKYLDPPLIDLETSVVQQGRASGSFTDLYFRSTMFMALLFIARALADDIWEERARATLRRIAVAPVSLRGFLAGRVVFVALVFLIVATTGLLAMRFVGGARIANFPGAALWLVFTGTAFFVVFLLLAMYSPGQRAADIIGNLVVFPLVLVGGSFFPFEVMPDWMAALGRLTPNGWAVTQFRDILTGAVNPKTLAIGAASMAAVAATFFLLAVRRLRRGFLV
jgi:ABC-type Na+ efflux pump permease subunit